MWDRVRRRDQTNTFRLSLSLSVPLRLSLSFHLLDSLFLSFSLHHHRPRRRGFSFPFSVAPELWQTRYQFLTFARKRAFSLFLHLSFLLDDNVEAAPVLSRWSRPLPSALSFLPDKKELQAAVAGAIPLLSPIV